MFLPGLSGVGSSRLRRPKSLPNETAPPRVHADGVIDTVPGVGTGEFDEFYRVEHVRLGRATLLLTGRVSEAEDLAQEAFVRVYERWARVRQMESPTGYLYRTALNLHRKRLRRLVSKARTQRSVGDGVLTPDVAEDRLDVLRAVAQLPLPQRQALVLVDWLGYGAEEAGRAPRDRGRVGSRPAVQGSDDAQTAA